jgi:hypothetical protein
LPRSYQNIDKTMVNTLLQPAAMMRVQLVNLAVMKFMSLIKKGSEENCTVSVSGGVAAWRHHEVQPVQIRWRPFHCLFSIDCSPTSPFIIANCLQSMSGHAGTEQGASPGPGSRMEKKMATMITHRVSRGTGLEKENESWTKIGEGAWILYGDWGRSIDLGRSGGGARTVRASVGLSRRSFPSPSNF